MHLVQHNAVSIMSNGPDVSLSSSPSSPDNVQTKQPPLGHLVLFYDGIRLVSFFFTNPTDTTTTPPRFWVAEHEDEIRPGVDVAYRMRYIIMASLCHALDAMIPGWHQQR